ncbi:NUDIX domain containing protein [Nitzschia inconspicua]|uniref:NUDIX domain containing protein n=1 Tax=Nitzschia inconspicua TaxID=303405 RepID=A0A9K3PY89_9STRA|nr:NUDIX domain containing protein [Nitzschia inconspicua]
MAETPSNASSHHQWSIPADRTVDHPLNVFRQYQKRTHSTPLFDRDNATIDYDNKKKTDYRAFGLLIHPKHGAILLHCTRKKKKPPHYQLPGGHVDDEEFHAAAAVRQTNSTTGGGTTKNLPPNTKIIPEQLYLAARMGCAREIYEETSIDLRGEDKLDRLLPMMLRSATNNNDNNSTTTLINEYKHRIFFVAQVDDTDFATQQQPCPPSGSVRYVTLPQQAYDCNLMLQLSVEHSGFRFFKDPNDIVQQLSLHSGGKVSEAVAMAYRYQDDS